MALFTSSFQALRRLGLNVRVFLVESLAEISASAGLVLAGAGVAGAAFGRAIGYAVGAAVAAVIAGRLLGRRALELRERRRDLEREIARYGRPLVATNSAYTLFGTIDIQLIGVLLSSRAVGLFAAPLKLVTFFSYVGQSAANAIAPRMAGADPDVRSFTAALRGLLILQWLVIVPVVVWAQPLLVLALGEEFRPAGEVLQLLAPYVFLRGLSPLITVTVNYLGEAGRRVKLVIACLLLNAAIDAVLLPTIGVIGAAIGTSVSYLVYVPAHLRICRESFDLPLRPLAVTFLRAGLAAAAAAGVLALVGTRDLSVWAFTGGAIGAVAAFVAVLGVTGEIGPSDAGRLASAIRRRTNAPG
jgi:O-antigen/teichoic acid export membrane protein